MPVHEYVCDAGHKFERFFPTFKEAEAEAETTLCDVCQKEPAERIISLPGQPILVGDGFYKPATGSIVRTTDVTKFIKEENIQVMNPMTGEKVGRRMYEREIAKAKKKARKK